MARQLDFSPLDFRAAILADPVGKSIAGTIRELGDITARTIEKREAKKEKLRKDFVDQMTYDTSITGNNIINNRVAYEYGKLRDKHLKVMQERRGWLTPEDMINLRSDMQGLSSLANQLKGIQNLYDTARQAAISKDGRDMYDLDAAKWGDLMAIVSGENETTNLIGELNNIQKSDTEIPFLNYQVNDILTFENDLIKPYRTTFTGNTELFKRTSEKGGKQYTDSKKITTYGSEEDAKDFYKGQLLKLGQRGIGYIKAIQQNLTPEQKQEALQQYGPRSENRSDTPYIDYYLNNVFNPEKLLRSKEDRQFMSKPTTSGGGGLSLFFGGGGRTPQQGQTVPKPDQIEGLEMKEYVEFAKAGVKPKSVGQVTVTGAERINRGSIEPPKNLDRISDYKVAGYSLDRNKIIITAKDNIAGTQIQKTYMVPYKGNEHFLDGLFDEESLNEIRRRSNMPPLTQEQSPYEAAATAATAGAQMQGSQTTEQPESRTQQGTKALKKLKWKH